MVHAAMSLCEDECMNLAGVIGGVVATGAAVAAWGAVSPSSQMFGPTVRRLVDARAIALTFDDGPNPMVTPRLLELLDQYEAKATFFLMGAHVRECIELTWEIAARGHALGNHTYTHPNLAMMSTRKIEEELAWCGETIESAAGKRAPLVRPPFGFRGPQLGGAVRRSDMGPVVMWSAMARDWQPQPSERVSRRLRRVRGGDIVLLHDGDHRVLRGDRMHTVEALKYWMPRWVEAGYRFDAVTQEEA
jgi:peptidoglycan/xylan/chitin deacetylase (PgdA/CDA1 family)